MRPAFRRGWVGEGKAESSPWRGPAGKARHTGAAISALGTKGQSPSRSRQSGNGGGQPPSPRSGKQRHPCTAQRRRTPCARDCGPAGVRQGERHECQRVSARMPRPQGARSAGQSASVTPPARHSRSRSSPGRAGTTGPVCVSRLSGLPEGQRQYRSNVKPMDTATF